MIIHASAVVSTSLSEPSIFRRAAVDLYKENISAALHCSSQYEGGGDEAISAS